MNTIKEARTYIADGVDRAAIAQFARKQGLAVHKDDPGTDTVRESIWSDGDVALTFFADSISGLGLILIRGELAQLQATLAERFELRDPAALVESAGAADDVLTHVRSSFALGTLLDLGVEVHDATELLIARLADEREMVRWSAARALRWQIGDEFVDALAHASTLHPDLAGEAQFVRDRTNAMNDGTFGDGPTDSWYELIRRARQGVADEQWKRVERATEMLLEDAPYHSEGLLLRGLAYEALGEPALGAALVGASRFEQLIDPENDRHTDELLTEASDALERITSELGEVAVDQRFESEVERWFATFRDSYHRAAEAGFAASLVGRVPSHEALFALIAGSWEGDVELLTRATHLAPTSYAALLTLAGNTEDPETQEALYRQTMAVADIVEQDPVSALLDRHASEFATPIKPTTALLEFTRLLYDQQRWDDTIELADRLVVQDPDSTFGWQVRANARTFGLRHEEAVPAYEEALVALDRLMEDGESIYFGDDPRPGMHFNLSCVLAKLGRRDEALDALRKAVRADEKWADDATGDDYWEQFHDDADFLAVVALEPGALVCSEELERPFLQELVTRALGLSYNGEVDGAVDAADRAIQLAQLGGHTDLRLRALAIRGRTLAFHEDPLLGLESLEEAMRLVDATVPPDVLAELTHEYGVVLHAAGELDRAAEAYESAKDQRAQTYGASHPVLAKSYGDMARLAADQQDMELCADLLRAGTRLLDLYFVANPPDDDTTGDALVDRASLWCKRAHMAVIAEDAEAPEYLERTVASLEALMAMRYTAWNTFDEAQRLLEFALANPASEEETELLLELRLRLEDLEFSSDPAVRAEQKFWRGLRNFVGRMLDEGVSGETLAETFQLALRGDELPDELRNTPQVGGLTRAFAERAGRFPTFVVSAAMALSIALEDGDIDGALEDLEAICVASVGIED